MFFLFRCMEFGDMASRHHFCIICCVNWHISGVGVAPEIIIINGVCSQNLLHSMRWVGQLYICSRSSCSDVWNLVIWLPVIISASFAVSIDTSMGLVLPQKSSLSMGCTPKISFTVRNEFDNCTFVSDMWVPMQGFPVGTVDSSVVVVSSTCALAVQTVILSLSSDFDSSPFFLSPFLSPH